MSIIRSFTVYIYTPVAQPLAITVVVAGLKPVVELQLEGTAVVGIEGCLMM